MKVRDMLEQMRELEDPQYRYDKTFCKELEKGTSPFEAAEIAERDMIRLQASGSIIIPDVEEPDWTEGPNAFQPRG